MIIIVYNQLQNEYNKDQPIYAFDIVDAGICSNMKSAYRVLSKLYNDNWISKEHHQYSFTQYNIIPERVEEVLENIASKVEEKDSCSDEYAMAMNNMKTAFKAMAEAFKAMNIAFNVAF